MRDATRRLQTGSPPSHSPSRATGNSPPATSAAPQPPKKPLPSRPFSFLIRSRNQPTRRAAPGQCTTSNPD
jgi:hypothetical protein